MPFARATEFYKLKQRIANRITSVKSRLVSGNLWQWMRVGYDRQFMR